MHDANVAHEFVPDSATLYEQTFVQYKCSAVAVSNCDSTAVSPLRRDLPKEPFIGDIFCILEPYQALMFSTFSLIEGHQFSDQASAEKLSANGVFSKALFLTMLPVQMIL
eukprot:jgi/Botrbrau1/18498/Bobra.0072s0077.1